MSSQEEFNKERVKIALKWGFPVVIGVIGLITSTLLVLADIFPSTPQYVFKIVNGISIGLIVGFGFIWFKMEQKLQDRYGKSQNKSPQSE